MAPTPTTFYSAYCALADAVLFGYQALLAIIFQNRMHVFFCQFSRSTTFSSVRCSVLHSIALIIRSSIPAQILNPIVRRIAIVMTGLISGRWWSYKSKQNQAMYLEKPIFVFFPKQHIKTPIHFIWRWFFQSCSFEITHSPTIRDFIVRFVSDYWQPSFSHRNPPMPKMGIWGLYTNAT